MSIPRGTFTEVLCRCVVELVIDSDPRSAIAHVGGFQQELPRQLLLQTE